MGSLLKIQKIQVYLALLALMMVLSSCAIGPDFVKPTFEPPKSFTRQEVQNGQVTVNQHLIEQDWWSVYDDHPN
jgi:hypothetical protein